MLQTKLLYIDDAQRVSANTSIIAFACDENGWYCIVCATPFYPQGGGQPSDIGHIEVESRIIPITQVKLVDAEIRHYTDKEYHGLTGKAATLVINKEMRSLHSQYHTAGHLLAQVVEMRYPALKAVKGNHFPDRAYVEFAVGKDFAEEIALDAINDDIQKVLQNDISVSSSIVSDEDFKKKFPEACVPAIKSMPYRLVQIGNWKHQPCSGTHVKQVQEITSLTAIKKKKKEYAIQIRYALA